jgi:hypothetical protein
MDDWGLGVKQQTVQDKIKEEIEEQKAEKKAQEHNVFHIISSAVDRKFIPAEDEYDKIPPYLFLRYFSNDPTGLILVSELNVRKNIPKKWEYWFMRYMMPESIRYIRFNKKDKFEDEQFLENLCHYYKCNDRQALEYLEVLPEEEVKRIKDMYRHGRA